MTSPQQLPLYQKLYMLIKLLYKTTKNIPKEYKYSIGNETITLAWNCMDLFYDANGSPNALKYDVISQLSREVDKVKCRLRMMQEIGLISIDQFTHLQTNYIHPIGDQTGGWLRWAENLIPTEDPIPPVDNI